MRSCFVLAGIVALTALVMAQETANCDCQEDSLCRGVDIWRIHRTAEKAEKQDASKERGQGVLLASRPAGKEI
jgi:hypothetical protein